MTPSERSVLSAAGRDLERRTGNIALATFLYGLSIPLLVIATLLFLKRGLDSPQRRMMFTASLVSFLVLSIYWLGYVVAATSLVVGVAVTSENLGKWHMAEQFVQSTQPLSMVLMVLISDGIVVWRACVIARAQRWVIFTLLASLLGTTATALAFLLGALIPKFLETHAQVVTNAFMAWLVLSLGNNLFATSTFAYTLWSYHKFMGSVGLGSRQPTRAQKILTVIVESGIICFIIQAVSLKAPHVAPVHYWVYIRLL
ncbi:hypothetical protein LshimejAT787_0201060 [Lyophyllum shimeji]|uniref:Uncharacterized protein n=1 Tax=Lyophyllum shimeji TaxID=47721 RepID=A0A9P3UKN6_LYOSH|nr:hypothetical protein LshimejAT787_0201060 [Lyophyllum shimeji]